jgi:hypothetical protein
LTAIYPKIADSMQLYPGHDGDNFPDWRSSESMFIAARHNPAAAARWSATQRFHTTPTGPTYMPS